MANIQFKDYSLVGKDTALAIENGLAEAEWYTTPVPKEVMRKLTQRRNGPAIRDTALLVALLLTTGYATVALWGTWWVVIPYLIYAVLYGTSSDSRWHECAHGTAFKTDWMNFVVYEIASFMVMRESVVWRWSHTRHHSDTIIVGRDPEIQVPRPPNIRALLLSICNVGGYRTHFPNLVRHALGRMSDAEATFIPASEFPKVYRTARLWLAIYAVVIGAAIFWQSWIPIFLFVVPQFFGTWLMIVHNTTQHAGLAENVLDYRLNCRTVYMNPISRFIYWNMNYHLEHHMFPLVPYHALPKLHAAIKSDCPPPYPSIATAWREIIPTLLRQRKDTSYYVKRELPTPAPDANARPATHIFTAKGRPVDGWVEICDSRFLRNEDVLRFDHDGKTYAVYRTADGRLYATDGVCTHGNAHLAEGFVTGTLIECAKHNGRFDVTDGSPQRLPVCIGLKTYQTTEHDGNIFLNVASASGGDLMQPANSYQFRVISNDNVATFIKELVLEIEPGSPSLDYRPGEYLQFNIPAYEEIRFDEIAVTAPFDKIWRAQNVFGFRAENPLPIRRNFSFATAPQVDKQPRFNVRISTPPPGLDCNAGAGTTYLHRLRPGETVSAIGPFGDFHIKSTDREMVYLGGGAGMAPLRSHLAHLFQIEKTTRRVSFWYGARSLQESFYRDYFERLAMEFPNFSFHLALSEPRPEDNWQSHVGFIHDVLHRQYLAEHPDPASIEYYLCGPPAMIQAALTMLSEMKVDKDQIAFDEF